MKHFWALTSLLLCTASQPRAQDWLSVQPKDTLFFAAGPHAGTPTTGTSLFPYPLHVTLHMGALPSVVRALFTTDTIINTDGSLTFHFPHAIRDTSHSGRRNNSNCMDTAAPSWMGRYMIHATNGAEYYQNSRGDTILILTQAQAGDQWIIARTSTGGKIVATLTYAGLTSVDGTTDSFKHITLQAFANGAPVAHWCNSLVLEWSKHHGWLKVLDFYRFPNSIWHYDYGGEFVDSTQHRRLPAALADAPFSQDALAEYVPGNEWIIQHIDIWNADVTRSFRRDSVCSVKKLSGNALEAEIAYYDYADNKLGYSLDSGKRLDTIAITPAGQRFKDVFIQRSGDVTARFFVNDTPICGNFLFSQDKLNDCGFYGYQDSCMRLYCLDGLIENRSTWLQPFGRVQYFYCINDLNGAAFLSEDWLSYFKLGNCSWGTRTYPRVGVGTEPYLKPIVQLTPSPANEQLRITCSGSTLQNLFLLRNSLGQVVFRQTLERPETIISTAQLPAGLYFAEVINTHSRWTGKVLIMH